MELPDEIYVSGMPLLWRGWNGKYVRDQMDDSSKEDDSQEWHLSSHNYYGIGIRPAKICIRKHRWVLITKDISFLEIARRIGKQTLLGDWGDIYVSSKPTFYTFWRSNSGIIQMIMFFIFVLIVFSL